MADPLQLIRNVGIIAHIDAGKTTTTESVLFFSGLEHRSGRVDDGNTVTDWMEEERKRGITITAADVTVPWKGHSINIIDTPGHVDFTAEVERSLRVLDGAVVVFDAVAGVQAQSETVWRQADRYRIPRIAYINKADRAGSNYDNAIESIRTRLGARAVPIQIPLGAGADFRGVVDLVTMTCRIHDPDSRGARFDDLPIPPEVVDMAELHRDELLHALADYDDALLEKYLDDQPIAPDEIRAAIRTATLAISTPPDDPDAPPVAAFVPVLCGSSLRNIGVQAVADAICHYLPSPLDVPPVQGTHPKTGDALTRKPDPKAHAAALVFKIASDQHGDLFFLRVYSGTLKTGQNYQNPRTGGRERIIHLYRMYANSREAIKAATPGDIVAVTGLKSCATGDTLCDPKHPIILGAMAFPDTVISMAIEPKTSDARDRLTEVLERLEREDPTFHRRIDPDTGQTIISGMGELHLEVLKHRMLSEYNVDANVGTPRVTYKETIRRPIDASADYVQPHAEAAQRATVALHLAPIAASSAATATPDDDAAPTGGIIIDFEPKLKAALPPPVRRGIVEALTAGASGGVASGYPMVGVHVTVTGAQLQGGAPGTPGADASALAGTLFEAAAVRALREGAEAAGIRLLEPWMKLEITTPDAFLGDILSDVASRRAAIERSEPLSSAAAAGGEDRAPTAGAHRIGGRVPLSSMFGYATALRSLSQGRATFSMEPLEYLPVPDALAEKFLL